jgi:hypothetical protein
MDEVSVGAAELRPPEVIGLLGGHDVRYVPLAEAHAELRGVVSGLPFRLDADTLRRGDSFTFTTDLGAIDILGRPAGTDGFDDLARTADAYELFGYRVLVASIDDLIRMKRAAGRPKDLLAIEELGALREELDRG